MAAAHYIYSSSPASGAKRTAKPKPPPKPQGHYVYSSSPASGAKRTGQPAPAPPAAGPGPTTAEEAKAAGYTPEEWLAIVKGGAGYQAAILGLSRRGGEALTNWGGLGSAFFADPKNKPSWMSEGDWNTAASANQQPGRLSEFFQLGQNRERGVSGVLTRLQGARVGSGARALKNNEQNYVDRVALGNAAALSTLAGLSEREQGALITEGERLRLLEATNPTLFPPSAAATAAAAAGKPAETAATTVQPAAVPAALPGIAPDDQPLHGGYKPIGVGPLVKPKKPKKPAPHYIYSSAPGSKRF